MNNEQQLNKAFDDQLREQLSQFEMPAPEGIFEIVSDQLSFDNALQESLRNMEIPAPDVAWQVIQSQVGSTIANTGLSLAGKWIIGSMIGATIVTATLFYVDSFDSERAAELGVVERSIESLVEDKVKPFDGNKDNIPDPLSNGEDSPINATNPILSAEAPFRNAGDNKQINKQANNGVIESQPRVQNELTKFSEDHTIFKAPVFSFDAKDTAICFGEEYRINCSFGRSSDFDVRVNGLRICSSTGTASVCSFKPERAGLYFVEYSVRIGDEYWKRTQMVAVHDLPKARVAVVDLGPGKYAFDHMSDNEVVWKLNGVAVNKSEVQLYDSRPTDYQVSALMTNQFGCKDSAQAEFRNNYIFEIKDLVMPNTFTPNGDGKNDQFRVEVKGIIHFRMLIFNSSSQVVFETMNPEEGWDGVDKFKNYTIESGTYTCIVEYTLAGREPQRQTKLIHLLKD